MKLTQLNWTGTAVEHCEGCGDQDLGAGKPAEHCEGCGDRF